MNTPSLLVFTVAGLMILPSQPRLFAQSAAISATSAVLVAMDPSAPILDLPAPNEINVPPGSPAPVGLMGGTPRSYNVEAWGGLLTPSNGVTIAAVSNVVDKARAGWRSTDGSATYAGAISASLVFTVDSETRDWPALTSWIAPQDTVRSAIRGQALPMAWDLAERYPIGVPAGSLGPSLYWMQKLMAAVPADRLGRSWQAGSLALQAGSMEITSADRPRHPNSGDSALADYAHVWVKRTANTILAVELTALMTANRLVVAPTPDRDELSPTVRLPNPERGARIRPHPSFPFELSYAY